MADASPSSPPPPALTPPHGSHLFRIRRTFALEQNDGGAWIVAMASHSLEKRQLLALAVASSVTSDDPHANYLVVRSVEEDRRVRHWRFPLAASRAKQQQQRVEPVVALAFSPEGDWLACLSSRKNRLHLVPVATLITSQRRAQLERAYHPPHNREWMSVKPSVMIAPMASYLRATNEAGGLNGARYHSRVAGDESQMSTLEFAAGMGTVTCCRWWRSMNGTNYCLVGGTENIISIVNVEDNAEECRCELQNGGTIESIELFYESFRKEKRTSMLVKTRARESDAAGAKSSSMSSSSNSSGDTVVKYYRVVLEKKTLQKKPKRESDEPATAATSASAATTNSSSVDASDSSDASKPASDQSSFTTSFVFRPAPVDVYVIKTFPQHFVEDMDFRPQRIKKNKPDVRLCAINGLLSSESGLAMYDATQQQVSVYSNFQWSLKGQYAVPTLRSSATPTTGPTTTTTATTDRIVDVDIAYCSSELMLLQGKSTATGTHVSTWVSLPSRPGFEDDQSHTEEEAHVVHYLSLHGDERVECVLQSTSVEPSMTAKSGGSQRTADASDGGSGGGGGGTAGDVIYIIQTAHNVYECRPQWSRLALYRALRGQSIALQDALSIGYALGIDMASLCEVVADTLCSQAHGHDHHGGDGSMDAEDATRQWVHDLYEVSRALPSKAMQQLTRIKATKRAIAYAKRVLTPTATNNKDATTNDGDQDDDEEEGCQLTDNRATSSSDTHHNQEERHRVALLVVDLILHEQAQHSFHADASGHDDHLTLRPREPTLQDQLDANDAWLMRFLRQRQAAEEVADYDANDMIDLCLTHHQTDKAVAVAIARNAVAFMLTRLVERGQATALALPMGKQAVDALCGAGFANQLLAPRHRLVLRSLDIDTQLRVLLATSSLASILRHRDWIVRHVRAFSKPLCIELVTIVDPSADEEDDDDQSDDDDQDDDDEEDEQGGDDYTTTALTTTSDVSCSEFMVPTPEERVELFLTLLLQINHSDAPQDEDGCGSSDHADRFSQRSLQSLLHELASQYRPPILIARCVDFENWSAAASLHQAHGEVVDAVECRLHAHQRRMASRRGGGSHEMRHRRRHSSKESLSEEHEEGDEEDEDQETADQEQEDDQWLAPLRQELLEMVDTLVVVATPTPTPPQAPQAAAVVKVVSDHTTTTTTTRAAILARLLVKWFEYGLARRDLEVHLIDSKVFAQVAAPLAQIFFSEIMDKVGRGSSKSSSSHPTSSSSSVAATTTSTGFDERDKAWVRRCHTLPFSGQFLFHVCMWLLGHQPQEPTTSSTTSSFTPSQAQRLRVVRENMEKNDLAIRAVRIPPQSAQAIGKSDPLETHVKAFSCGHFFPKRVFEEDVVPEFEKRMNALPTPLFGTKQLLLSEYKRGHVEAPCPVCALNKISRTLFDTKGGDEQAPTASRDPEQTTVVVEEPSSVYFLHGRSLLSSAALLPLGGANQQQRQQQQQQEHEEWEWRP